MAAAVSRLLDLIGVRSRAEGLVTSLPALHMEADKAMRSVLLGDHRQGRAGTGEKFWQFREYTQGDRPQDIDWRQSGKSDRIFIRQKEWQTAQNCFFWCSSGAGMNYASDEALNPKGDAGRIILMALAVLMTRAGEHIGAYGAARTGRSNAALDSLGLHMLDLRLDDDLPPDHTRLPRHAHCILAGDFLSPLEEIEARFKTIAAQSENVLLLQVLDPAEIELPFEGRWIFEDIEASDRQERIENVGSIRDIYRERIAAHMQGLQDICRKTGWDYALHRTDHPIAETLNHLWQAIAPKDIRG